MSAFAETIWWRSPAEDMPDDLETVLFVTTDQDVYMGYHDDGEWWVENSSFADAEVKAWAPCPEGEPDQPELLDWRTR
jgi:hypothetical protein